MTEVSVSVVIPTWNRRDLLVRVLGALAAQSLRAREVIVVDNGSTDDSADAAEDAGARVLRLPTNAGFARAVNAGLVKAHGARIAILNNDVDLAEDWLARLSAALEPADVWFATGKILRAQAPGQLDGAFDLLARSGFAWRAGHGRKDGALWNQPRPIFMASMTAALFKRELFDRIGLLDEEYGSYYEDVDFGLRCALRGLKGRYVPEALAWHEGSATLGAWTPALVEQITRNQRLLVRKHFASRWSWPVVLGQALWAALAWKRGCAGAWRRGRADGESAVVSLSGPQPELPRILAEMERELRTLQRQSRPDTYWLWYERLTADPGNG